MRFLPLTPSHDANLQSATVNHSLKCYNCYNGHNCAMQFYCFWRKQIRKLWKRKQFVDQCKIKKNLGHCKKNPSFFFFSFFFHSFIGRSSCDIQYKFIIQHKNRKEKKKRKEAKTQKGRCNGTNVPCEARPLD